MSEKRAGRPVLDFVLATFSVGLILAVLTFPVLTVIAALVLAVMWFAGVGA